MEEPPFPMGLHLEGGFHLEEPPSPMGDAFDGGFHLEDPPSPITAMAITVALVLKLSNFREVLAGLQLSLD